MPTPTHLRDYKRERRLYHGLPRQKRENAARKRARRAMGLKTGDPREVDHKKMLKNGGSNDKSNLRVVSRAANRRRKHK